MQYLFKKWDQIKAKLKNKQLFIFLDYDGTLTPIVKIPEKAVVSAATKAAIKKISNKPSCKIAIISGRALKDVKEKISLDNIIYSGNHGLEIKGPKIRFKTTVTPEYISILSQIKKELKKKISLIKGAFIEDKGLSLSLHFRLVDKKLIPLVMAAFQEAVTLYLARNKIKVKPGKMVLEVRPALEWDKGKVVLWLLARQKFAKNGKPIFPIYIGDDLTDEDAFVALKGIGLTVIVGNSSPSLAQYYLKDTNEVRELLENILKIESGNAL